MPKDDEIVSLSDVIEFVMSENLKRTRERNKTDKRGKRYKPNMEYYYSKEFLFNQIKRNSGKSKRFGENK